VRTLDRRGPHEGRDPRRDGGRVRRQRPGRAAGGGLLARRLGRAARRGRRRPAARAAAAAALAADRPAGLLARPPRAPRCRPGDAARLEDDLRRYDP
jgi:hypothetical protein